MVCDSYECIAKFDGNFPGNNNKYALCVCVFVCLYFKACVFQNSHAKPKERVKNEDEWKVATVGKQSSLNFSVGCSFFFFVRYMSCSHFFSVHVIGFTSLSRIV